MCIEEVIEVDQYVSMVDITTSVSFIIIVQKIEMDALKVKKVFFFYIRGDDLIYQKTTHSKLPSHGLVFFLSPLYLDVYLEFLHWHH